MLLQGRAFGKINIESWTLAKVEIRMFPFRIKASISIILIDV